MAFSDLHFIFLFLPVFLLVYYFSPASWWNAVVFIGSLVFYGIGVQGHWWMLGLLAGEVVFTYFAGLMIGRTKDKAVAAFCQVLLFALLFFFKYDSLAGLSIAFPLALSFYTFQMSAYLTDVARGTIPAVTNFFDYGAGVLLFVRLISGPITPWKDIHRDLERRRINWNCLVEGLRDFIIGLSLKLLLADSLSGIWAYVENTGITDISTPMAWLGIVGFSLNLYFDFWGYSRMAIGLGRMLGFEIPVNFRYPYISKTMTEFWRRWHITLGAWFRNYIYIPLGGSRVGAVRLILNLFVVWLFTGLWHGSTLNFLVWGVFLFVVIVLEKFIWGKLLERTYVLGHLYMILLIPLSWMIFAIPDVPTIVTFTGRLFGQSKGIIPYTTDFLAQLDKFKVFLGLGVLFSTPLPNKLYEKFRQTPVADLVLFALFWLCIYRMSLGLADPFTYFSF